MTNQTIAGMLCLYKIAVKFQDKGYNLEVIDRALDEFVRNPNRTSDSDFLVKSSIGSSKKVIKSRQISKYEIYNDEQYEYILNNEDSTRESDLIEIENIDFITKSIKNNKYAEVIVMIYKGATAEDVARKFEITNKHANTLISRARAFAKKSLAEVV